MKRATAGSFVEQDIDERFWAKVDKSAVPDGCFLWTAAKSNGGYGFFKVKIDVGVYRQTYAHIWSYERHVGPVPEGWEVEHACHSKALALELCAGGDSCPHRACVRPSHLEAVTCQENNHRGNPDWKQKAARDRCPEGHLFDETNTYWYGRTRQCRACNAARARAYRGSGERGVVGN